MPFPLVPLAVIAGSQLVATGANLYSQAKQRELYRYQRGGYERYISNWQKANPGKKMRYPELNAPGNIRSLDTGISQSYASSYGSTAGLVRSMSTGYGLARSGGLFGKTPSRTSKWL